MNHSFTIRYQKIIFSKNILNYVIFYSFGIKTTKKFQGIRMTTFCIPRSYSLHAKENGYMERSWHWFGDSSSSQAGVQYNLSKYHLTYLPFYILPILYLYIRYLQAKQYRSTYSPYVFYSPWYMQCERKQLSCKLVP